MTLKLSFPSYRIRIPSAGQEGGGVFWNPWQDSSAYEFLRVWEKPTKAVIVRAYGKDQSYFEICVDPHGGEAEYTVRRGDAVSCVNVTREEFQKLVEAETVEPVVMGIDIGGESEAVELRTDPDVEYLYRIRTFMDPTYAWKNNCGPSDWQYCDKDKYDEVVWLIRNSNNPYQAQRIPAEPDQNVCVDLKARGWDVPIYRYRTVLDDGATTDWVSITRAQLWKLKQSEADRRDSWNEYEVSRNGGSTWEAL